MSCRITSIIERNVVTIDQYRSVSESVGMMVDRGAGSIVVTGGGKVVGYFTERDLLVRVVGKKRDPATTLISDVMTKDLVRVDHGESCSFCLERMKENKIRHLLVYKDNHFIGVISLRFLAALMAKGSANKDFMVNVVGGVVLVVTLVVIGFLVYMVPDMLQIIQRFVL